MTTGHPYLEARDLTFSYPRSDRTFGPFDRRFDAGVLTVLTGPSGCGKSTYLSLLGGLLQPTSGSVRRHHVTGGAPVTPNDVAWVFQQSNALGSRSVADNVKLARILDPPAQAPTARDIGEALAAVGLAGFDEAQAKQLSGGERQRMCVARAILSPSDVILADEPTGQLDEANSNLVAQAFLAASRRKVVIVVTHDLELAATADVHLRLSDGVAELVSGSTRARQVAR